MESPQSTSISIMFGLQSTSIGVDIPVTTDIAVWEDDINAAFADDANAIHEDH